MAIFRLELPKLRRGQSPEWVTVHELHTSATLLALADELDDDGLHGDALWHRARAREMRANHKGTCWIRSGEEPLSDLSHRVRQLAYQTASMGKRTACFCIY